MSRVCGCPGPSGSPHLPICDFYGPEEEDQAIDTRMLMNFVLQFNPHLLALVRQSVQLEDIHMGLHLVGDPEDSDAHQRCLDLMDQVDARLEKAKAGPWN